MANLPTADQFPSLKETFAFLKETTQQCIWHLPSSGRLCKCKTTIEDTIEAIKLLAGLKKSPPSSIDKRVEILTEVVELCCCPRHHRSKAIGTGLSKEVASAWYQQLKLAAPSSVTKQPAVPASPRRMFAKHQVHTTESIVERLCSNLDPDQGTSGSIYFYTHKATAFAGMIKIGYTCRSIAKRLLDWGDCGHGDPSLLASISDVRHPERVELLTHFELEDVWHEMMWCKPHGRTHIEWFKTDIDKAKEIASRWNRWMHEANPYDRRGKLKPVWEKRCEVLQERGYAISSCNMLRLHEVDVGRLKKEESEKSPATSKKSEIKVKAEKEDTPLRTIPSRREKASAPSERRIKVEETCTRVSRS